MYNELKNMRKVLFFAIALVASVLALTSCNGNNPNDPLIGTWQHIEDYGDARSEQKVTFDGRDNFTYSDFKYMGDQVHYGQIIKGSYKIDGDIVTIHYAECSWTNDGQEYTKQDDFSLADEQIKYSIEGNTLTVIRLYGTGSAYTETYTKL